MSKLLKQFQVVGENEEHRQYLRQLRREYWLIKFSQLTLLLLLLGLWEVASSLHWINPLLFSSPKKIFLLFLEMISTGEIYRHAIITILETIVGFLLGTILGTLVAILIWFSPFLSKVLDPYIVVLNGLPKVALGPLFIVAFGGGYIAIIAMAIAISIIVTIIVVYSSFQEVDENYLKLARSFGATKRQSFSKIVWPASLSSIIATLKVNVGLAWVGVIVGEFLVSKAGLGYLMIYGFQVFNLTLVMLSLLLIGLFATIMYQGVSYIERRILRR